MALLLIDSRILDTSFILRCLKSNVTPVIFDYEMDTFETITEKIPQKMYANLGIIPYDASDTFCLISSFGDSVLKDVERIDPCLDTWTTFHLLIELCVSQLGICCLDMIACFHSGDFEYISYQWNLPIGYSSSPLGKTANGTNWNLKEGSLLNTYFLQSIEYYPYTIGKQKEYNTLNKKYIPYEKQILFRILNKK